MGLGEWTSRSFVSEGIMNITISPFFLKHSSLCSLALLVSLLGGCAANNTEPTESSEAPKQTALASKNTPKYVVQRASIRTPSSNRFQARRHSSQYQPTYIPNRPSANPVFRKASVSRAVTNSSATRVSGSIKPALSREYYQQRYEADQRRKEVLAEQDRAAKLEQARRERMEYIANRQRMAEAKQRQAMAEAASRQRQEMAEAASIQRRAAQEFAKKQTIAKKRRESLQLADRKVENVIQSAASNLGTMYVWGGSSPSTGFDCSGLVQHSLKTGANVLVPRTAAQQYAASVKVSSSQATRGDLVFFRTRGSRVSHVGIYLGNNRFIHAPRTGKAITTSTIEGYWQDRLVGFGRIPGACRFPIKGLS